jgi:hypothetical protein
MYGASIYMYVRINVYRLNIALARYRYSLAMLKEVHPRIFQYLRAKQDFSFSKAARIYVGGSYCTEACLATNIRVSNLPKRIES